MKILLISPPITVYEADLTTPGNVVPLGIAYIASYVRETSQKDGWNCDLKILDCLAESQSLVTKYQDKSRFGFSDEQILPAVGQGVIALQCRIDDKKTLDILKMINDKESYYCIQAERALLEAIGGDCDTAVGALAKLSEDKIILKSELFSNDGKKKFEFQSSSHFEKAKELGYAVGKELLKKAGSNFKTRGN